MTTFAQVIHRTRRLLMGAQREGLNVLAGTIDSDDTTVTLVNPVRFVAGARLSIELETVLAVQPDTNGTTSTVIRAVEGSTAAAHTAGVHVEVNPTRTNADIADAVNDELAHLSSPMLGLFRVRSVDFDFVSTQRGYELTGLDDFQDVWRVRYQTSGPEKDWPILNRTDWRVDRAADTTEFPSGVQLVVRDGQPGQKIRMSYKAGFDPLVTWADDVLVVSGLHREAHDILSLGAAIRIMLGEEAQRSFTTTQPDPGRLEGVPPRTAAGALGPLVAKYEEMIAQEKARLLRFFPESIR